jgi:hypothetical protein
MNETWTEEPIGPQLYGSGIFGSFYYGSAEWTDGTTPSATWTNLTDAALTWTNDVTSIFFGNITNTVVASVGIRVTSSSIVNGGGYFGNWANNGNTGESDHISITAFDSSGGLRVSLNDRSRNTAEGGTFLANSNPSGGLQDNDKIIFWGEGIPSNLVAGIVYYVKQTSDATKINLRTASGGNAIAYVDSGSGIPDDPQTSSHISTAYCSTTFFEATGGAGSGFIATYHSGPASGGIGSVNIIAPGNYTTLPSAFTATCPSTRFHYQGYSGAPACLAANVSFSGSLDLLFTDTDHTLIDGDDIQFTTTGTLPGNITADTNYYVNDKTATTFRVETVVGGGNVQYSSAGSGVKYGKIATTWSEQTPGSITWAEA